MAVGQFSAPNVANRYRNAVGQQDPTDRGGGEPRQFLHHWRQEGEGGEYATVTQRGDGVNQQQAWMSQHFKLLANARAGLIFNVVGYQDDAGHRGNHANKRHRQEGFTPAKMLADKGPQGYPCHQRYGQAAEHNGDRRGGFLFRNQTGGDSRADGEEYPVGQAGQQAGHNQRLIARRLPGQQVAEGKQHHQADQQQLARYAAG
ncbi:hypothetical protein D3C85_1271600 [compost metagenome]